MIQAAWLWYFKDHRSKSLLEHHLNNHLLLAHDQPFLRISLKSIHYFWVVFQWTDGRTDGWMDGCNRTIFLSLVFFLIFSFQKTLYGSYWLASAMHGAGQSVFHPPKQKKLTSDTTALFWLWEEWKTRSGHRELSCSFRTQTESKGQF